MDNEKVARLVYDMAVQAYNDHTFTSDEKKQEVLTVTDDCFYLWNSKNYAGVINRGLLALHLMWGNEDPRYAQIMEAMNEGNQ